MDFDNDGAPELLAQGEILELSFLKPAFTGWIALKSGATGMTDKIALMPSVTRASGDFTLEAPIPPDSLPLARETIAWDAKTQEPMILRRTAQGWQAQPVSQLKGERLQAALAIDADKDGLINDYLLQTQSGKLAHFKLTPDKRLQFQKLEPTPPAIGQFLRDARSLMPAGGEERPAADFLLAGSCPLSMATAPLVARPGRRRSRGTYPRRAACGGFQDGALASIPL